jgi:hypothetical protein
MSDRNAENRTAKWIIAASVCSGGLLAVVITGSIIQPPVSLIELGAATIILMILAPVLMGVFAFTVATAIRAVREAEERWLA